MVIGVGIVRFETTFGGGVFFPTGLGDKDAHIKSGFVMKPSQLVFDAAQGVLASASGTAAKTRIGIRVRVPIVNLGEYIWSAVKHASEEIEGFHCGRPVWSREIHSSRKD